MSNDEAGKPQPEDTSADPQQLKKQEGLIVPPRPRTFALVPQSLSEAMAFAEQLAKSTLVPDDFRGKPGNILMAVQFGAEVGLSPIQSLLGLYVIHGRVGMPGDTQMAIIRGSGELLGFRKWYDREKKTGYCWMKRRGYGEWEDTFTEEDAMRVKVKERDAWIPLAQSDRYRNWPQRMYPYRAQGFVARDLFGDILKGMKTEAELAEELMARGQVIDITPTERGGGDELQAQIEDAFENLEYSPAQKIAARARFRENLQELLEHLRDEWAARNLGKVRDHARGPVSGSFAVQEGEVVSDAPAQAAATGPAQAAAAGSPGAAQGPSDRPPQGSQGRRRRAAQGGPQGPQPAPQKGAPKGPEAPDPMGPPAPGPKAAPGGPQAPPQGPKGPSREGPEGSPGGTPGGSSAGTPGGSSGGGTPDPQAGKRSDRFRW